MKNQRDSVCVILRGLRAELGSFPVGSRMYRSGTQIEQAAQGFEVVLVS